MPFVITQYAIGLYRAFPSCFYSQDHSPAAMLLGIVLDKNLKIFKSKEQLGGISM